METTTTAYGCSPVLPSAGFRANRSACALPPCRVSVASFSKPRVPAPSFRVSCTRRRAPVARVAACSSETNSDATASPAEATVDLKLPRRSLLVQFTCDACGERTKRLINRVAYERGTVFVQCAGCQVYHKFVDNLGLVVEYDLREENGVNPNDEG